MRVPLPSRSIACILIILTLASTSCQRGRQERRVSHHGHHAPADDAAIIGAVEAQLDILARGISSNDADLIFSIFSSKKATVYVRDGEIEESVEVARESYRRALGQLKEKRSFSFQAKEFDILSEKAVMFTGLGAITGAELKRPWKIAYTILFVQEVEGWRALNMHISWENQK